MKGLTEAVNALERELVKTKTQLEIKVGTLSDDVKRVDATQKGVKEVCPGYILIIKVTNCA